MRRDGDPVPRIELCTRTSSAVPERRASILTFLRELDDEGAINNFATVTWPAEVEYESEHETLERFKEFEGWGEHVGAEIRPPFLLRTRRSLVSEPEREVLITPELCIAAYLGDELIEVRPCERNGGTETITEYLHALASERQRTAEDQTPGPPAQ